jgi:PAS domain S-box-containing protein
MGEQIQSRLELLNGIIEGSKDFIAALDGDFRFIAFNSGYAFEFEDIFGKKIELGMSLVDALAHLPQEQAKALDMWSRALRGEEFTVTEEFGDETRKRNYYEISYSAIKDANANLIGACHFVRVITEHKLQQGEVALTPLSLQDFRLGSSKEDLTSGILHWEGNKQTEPLLGMVLENLPIGVWIIDNNYQILMSNQAGYQIWAGNKSPESKQDTEYKSWCANTSERKTPEEWKLKQALESGEISIDELIEIECLDGSRKTLLSSIVPLWDTQQNVTGAIVINQDITERKQVEKSLRDALQRLTFHVENSPLPVIEWDSEFRICRWSSAAERVFGWKAEEVIGKKFTDWEFVIAEDLEAVAGVASRLNLGIEQRNVSRNRNYTKDGSILHCDWYNSTLLDESGKLVSVLSLILDVTDRVRLLQLEKAAREEAEKANRIKDEFLAIISHELRTPLNPILGWAMLLKAGRLDAQKTVSALDIIERNAKLQAELIQDLLDVSRILQGKLTLNVTTVNLESTILEASETVRLAAQAKTIDFRFLICDFEGNKTQYSEIKVFSQDYENLKSTIQNSQFLVAGDATRLQQVVWNLLSNAVKFTPQSGKVEIRLERVDSMVQITVSDTGKGINPKFLPYIFDYFRQEDSTTTRKFGGLGLGLAIARYIVDLHGGTIAAKSAGEGEGATFTVKLPLMRESSKPKVVIKPTTPDTPLSTQHTRLPTPAFPLSGTRVLVVDDDVDSLDFVTFVLTEYGAVVTSASDASQALQVLAESHVDVLVSDIGMPQMDGYELLRRIRNCKKELTREIRAIALTAYAGEFNQRQALAVGFQMHLSKPIEPDALVAAVARLIAL